MNLQFHTDGLCRCFVVSYKYHSRDILTSHSFESTMYITKYKGIARCSITGFV